MTALAPLVDAVVAEPVTGMTVAQVQERVRAVAPLAERLTGWVQHAAGHLQTLTGGELPTADGGRQSVAGWLADVRHQSPSAIGRELRTSLALQSLPLVVAAVLDGVLTPQQAAVLSRLVGKIDLAGLVEAQPQLVLVAADRDPAALADWVRHQIATHCEPALEADDDRGRAKRHLQTSRDADGSLRGRFVLPAEDAETFLTALEPLARRAARTDAGPDERSAGQRRADALVEMCEQVMRHGDLPEHGGQRPQLSYVLPADWAVARHAQAACTDCGPRCPAHASPSFADTVAAGLPGRPGVPAEHACAVAAWTGPQTRARIETVLCDARISRVLLDPRGQVRSLEALTDTVTAAQRRALAARDLGCTARGCTRPPAMCDAHHLRARADGGPTTLDNIVLLCRRHHVLWHLGKLHLQHLHVPWHPDSAPGQPPPEPAIDAPCRGGT